jgi:hypothetical protein
MSLLHPHDREARPETPEPRRRSKAARVLLRVLGVLLVLILLLGAGGSAS